MTLSIHASDCGVHNMPAEPNGPCNCGKWPMVETVRGLGGEDLEGHEWMNLANEAVDEIERVQEFLESTDNLPAYREWCSRA